MLDSQKLVVTNSLSQYYFPFFINLNKINVLVIGGGKVGSKRALKLATYGAKVTVVSLDFSEELAQNPLIRKIKIDANKLDEQFLRDFDIIITATNDKDLNFKLCEISQKLGKLCNNPTNPAQSSFIIPIFYADEDIEIAVTTLGKSTIASKLMLEKILEYLKANEKYLKLLVKTMGEVKKIMKERVSDPSLRYELYHKIFYDSYFQNFILNNNYESALKRAEEIINEHIR